jgi:hypothetical protein
MPSRCLIGLLLAVLLAVPASLRAQLPRASAPKDGGTKESHIPVPFHGPPNGRFEDFLKGRVEDAREHADTQEAWRDLLKSLKKQYPDDLEALKQKGVLDGSSGPPDLDDPVIRELLGRWLEKNRREQSTPPEGDGQPAGSASKEMVEALERLLKDAPKGGGVMPPSSMRPPPIGASGSAPQVNPQRELNPSQSVQPPPAISAPSIRQEKLREELGKFVEKMRDSSLGESPTLRQIGRELNCPILRQDAGEGDGILDKLPRLREYIPFKGLFSPDRLPSFGKPSWSGPRIPAATVPTTSGMQMPGEGTVIGLVWIALAFVVAVLLWKLLRGVRTPQTALQQTQWQLGPWPIHPAEVATRQDLIRAFEYLSLFLLGPAARAWNHVEIAGKLGASDDLAATQRRNAASQLAALYEQARYAPPHEPLPEDHLCDARRNLCLLAGVAAA